jgi:hypothetical protein
MPFNSKRKLQEENERLRERLEEAYEVIGDALESEENPRKSNARKYDDEE